ncbi:MAG: ISNCY family transposase [Acidobacteriota bacterium]|nr:ISNCY family transposase [Acidobacteriota bacterium]
MSQKELQRLKVVENAVEGRLSVAEAAELLQLSDRQVKRLKQNYDPGDAVWVRHGNHGRSPVNTIGPDVRDLVIGLAKGKYAGFNDSHLHEKLLKPEGFTLSRPSVRRILRDAGIRSPQKRRPPKYRSRRERRPQEGMLLQIDGSRHDWLEGRGPHLTLLGAVDDATNQVCAAHFQAGHEDSAGYLRLFRSQVEGVGIPWAIYRDQHGTLQRNDKHWSLEEELAGKQFPTQVGRALEELGIEIIVARSPQAKGRIERTWRTFQDRLTSELRLNDSCNLEQANAILLQFLAEYNARFGKPATRPVSVWRKLDSRLDLNYIFSLRYERTVGQDHVITAIPGVTIQLPPLASGRGYAGKTVAVCHQPNGDFHVYLERRLLHIQPNADAGPVRATRLPEEQSTV